MKEFIYTDRDMMIRNIVTCEAKVGEWELIAVKIDNYIYIRPLITNLGNVFFFFFLFNIFEYVLDNYYMEKMYV